VNESAFHPEDKAVGKVHNVIPEAPKKPPFDAEAWFARLDELGGPDFLPNGISDQPPAELDPRASSSTNDLMKDEYDFSIAERGKFFREAARLVPPIHLDPEVLDYLSERAAARGVSLSSLVNTLLKQYRTDRRRSE
jgi:hypothetical protein